MPLNREHLEVTASKSRRGGVPFLLGYVTDPEEKRLLWELLTEVHRNADGEPILYEDGRPEFVHSSRDASLLLMREYPDAPLTDRSVRVWRATWWLSQEAD